MPEDTLAALDKDIERGQRVGEYVIEGKLGEGGFGTVYRASHPVIGKLAAIKVLNRQFSVQREMVSRFMAEAKAVNQIRHRNIIDIFGFDQLEDGRFYYVMELLEGLTLAEHLERVPRMSLRDALPILRAVARAIDAAHAKGIVHRDLKPENIFLANDPDGGFFPKLLDFGIAKLMGNEEAANHKTRTGAPIGTPLYMSPEQCRGRDVDHRTDIYALGIVAFRMLTGRVPFDGDNYMTILMMQMTEAPPAPSSIAKELPLEIDQAIQWMLAKDPAARPASLTEAVHALERAAAVVGVSSPTWNATPPVGTLPSAPPRSGVSFAATLHASADAATQASISANRNTTPDVVVPAPRRTGLWIGLGLAALAAAGVAVVALGGGASDERPRTNDPVAVQPPVTPAPPVEAPPPPTPPVVVTPPAAPETVTLTFKGLPDNAIIYGPKRRALGLAKEGLTVPRSEEPLQLAFEADGQVLARELVVPSESREIEIATRPTRNPDRPRRRKTEPASPGGPAPVNPDSTERPAGL